MFDTLPDGLLINIIIFLNYKTGEILNCRLFNKRFRKIIDEPITIEGYPDINCNSLYFFTIEYLWFKAEMEKHRKEMEKEFDDNYINMLIDKGWV